MEVLSCQKEEFIGLNVKYETQNLSEKNMENANKVTSVCLIASIMREQFVFLSHGNVSVLPTNPTHSCKRMLKSVFDTTNQSKVVGVMLFPYFSFFS